MTVVGAMILGTGVVSAAIMAPGAPGVIHACVADAGGAVRIIGGDSCPAGERFVQWHKSGRQGAKGLQGIPGTNGTNGTNGAPGTNALPLEYLQDSLDTSTAALGDDYAQFDGLGDDFQLQLTPGTWMITANVRGLISYPANTAVEAGCYVVAQLTTDGSGIGGTESLVALLTGSYPLGGATGFSVQDTVPLQYILEVDEPGVVLSAQAKKSGCADGSAQILDDDNGATSISAVRIVEPPA